MNTALINIPYLLGKKVARQLVFDDDGLTLHKGYSKVTANVLWENLAALRLKVTPISGVYCTVGRQYCIELKTETGEVHMIRLNSLYKIKRKLYEQLWSEVYQQLYNFHFRRVLNYYLELHSIGQVFEVSDVKIYTNGISWDNQPVLNWTTLEVNAYNRYFVLHSRHGNYQRKFLYYGRDWNAWLLLEVLKQVVSAKNNDIRRRRA
ncbi:hypothetical protein GCM10027037_06820 [Mucilaginibacter koreensis]